MIALTAVVSPYRLERERVRHMLDVGDFIEVYVNAPLELCEKRDPKGLYRKARAGVISDLTGVNAPYESPTNAELILNTASTPADTLADEVVKYLRNKRIIPAHE